MKGFSVSHLYEPTTQIKSLRKSSYMALLGGGAFMVSAPFVHGDKLDFFGGGLIIFMIGAACWMLAQKFSIRILISESRVLIWCDGFPFRSSREIFYSDIESVFQKDLSNTVHLRLKDKSVISIPQSVSAVNSEVLKGQRFYTRVLNEMRIMRSQIEQGIERAREGGK